MRFFDVDFNDALKQPVSKAVLNADGSLHGFEIVPCIYITNKTFQKTKHAETDSLASNVAQLIYSIADNYEIKFTTIQFDCDWTTTTAEKYFSFLEKIKNHFDSSVLITATIRLHQVKYADKTGIPPVNRGMLMFYNMGKLDDMAELNSIYNSKTASRYLKNLKSYKLPLDVALPIFSWGVQFRNNKMIALLNGQNRNQFENDSLFRQLSPVHFMARNNFLLNGNYFFKGDVVRLEESLPQHCKLAALQLNGKINNPDFDVVFYHLDSANISNYATKDFMDIIAAFH